MLVKACVNCNQKKIKCLPNENSCVNCLKHNLECVVAPFKRRGPDAQKLIELKRDKQVLERMVADQERVKTHRPIYRPALGIGHPRENQTISSEMSRRQPLREWTQMDMFLLYLPDVDGTQASLTDFYFRYVFRRLPVLSKGCMTLHLLDVDVHLIHAMYACCLVFHSLDEVNLKLAKDHIVVATQAVYSSLDSPNPMLIATLLHLIDFYKSVNDIQWTSHLAVAIKMAKVMGFQDDADVSWTSPRGTIMKSQDMCRGMWIMLYYFDFCCQFTANIPFTIDEENAIESIVIKHTSVNWDDPTGIPENALTYSKYLVPLFKICKQKYSLEVGGELSQDRVQQLLSEFDQWFYLVLPPSFRYQSGDISLKTKYISLVNFIYMHNRLGVVKHGFLSFILQPLKPKKKMPHGEEIISTLEILSAVCKCYIDVKLSNPKDISNDSLYFKQIVYQCSLICLILDKFGCFTMLNLEQTLSLFTNALGFMPEGMQVIEELAVLKDLNLMSVVDIFARYRFAGQMEFKDPVIGRVA